MLRACIDGLKEDCLLFLGALAALPASQSGLSCRVANWAEIEGPRGGSVSSETLPAAVGMWVTAPPNAAAAARTLRARQRHGLRPHDSARVAPSGGARVPTP